MASGTVSNAALLNLTSYERGPTGVARIGIHTQPFPKIKGFNGGPLTQTRSASARNLQRSPALRRRGY